LRENIVFSIGSNYTGSNDFKYEAYILVQLLLMTVLKLNLNLLWVRC